MVNDPLMYTIRLTLSYNDSMSRYLRDIINNHINDIEMAQSVLKTKIMNSISNRLIFYKLINPNFNVHDIYTKDCKVNEL